MIANSIMLMSVNSRIKGALLLVLAMAQMSTALETFNSTSSRECRLNCINKGGVMCLNVDFTEGTCCDSDADCRNFGLCSSDVAVESKG